MLCELALKGEREIEFELENTNIGMYVLHDVNLEFKNLKAQIDYIIITPAKVYFVECKILQEIYLLILKVNLLESGIIKVEL